MFKKEILGIIVYSFFNYHLEVATLNPDKAWHHSRIKPAKEASGEKRTNKCYQEIRIAFHTDIMSSDD